MGEGAACRLRPRSSSKWAPATAHSHGQLRIAGYDVTAIDPKAETPDVECVTLRRSARSGAAVRRRCRGLSLHHVEPLEESVERLAEVTAPQAWLLLDEFDASALDERAAAWWLGQRRARGGDEPEAPAELVETMRSKVHPIELLVGALSPWFEVGESLRGTYLYRWKLDETLRAAEERLVAAGELPPTGVRITARRRAR